MADTTAFELAQEGGGVRITPVGDWTMLTLSRVANDIEEVRARRSGKRAVIDVSRLGRLDTAGALMLARCAAPAGKDGQIRVEGEHAYAAGLIEEVAKSWEPAPKVRREYGIVPDRKSVV